MELINRKSTLWKYMTDDIRGLMVDGEMLLENAEEIPHKVTDYSYLVFPFAKGYEGFLKKLFLDLKMIKQDEYYGDDIRIGRILNPQYIKKTKNVFYKLVSSNGSKGSVAQSLWKMWHEGRNQVFHYFPHNFRKLTFNEALKIIEGLLEAMNIAAENFDLELNDKK